MHGQGTKTQQAKWCGFFFFFKEREAKQCSFTTSCPAKVRDTVAKKREGGGGVGRMNQEFWI